MVAERLPGIKFKDISSVHDALVVGNSPPGRGGAFSQCSGQPEDSSIGIASTKVALSGNIFPFLPRQQL